MAIDDRDALLKNWRLSSYSPAMAFARCWSVVVPVGDGTFRCYYTNSPGASAKIYVASSTNGKVWYGHTLALDVNAGQWDATALGTPYVWHEAGQARPWRMLYYGYSASVDGGRLKLGLATSADGLTWERKDTAGAAVSSPVITESVSLDLGCIIKVGSVYYCWYNSVDAPRLVYLATSTDLVTWTKHASNPIFRATTGADISGATVNDNRGRFCGDVVRWDREDGTTRYVAFIPHYTADGATPDVEVYVCDDPQMLLADREYIGVAYGSGDGLLIDGKATVILGDVIRTVTDDITRNVKTTTCTGEEVWQTTTASTTADGYATALMIHDRTLHGASLSNVSQDLPVAAPRHQLAPVGPDANTIALWLPGLTRTMLDLSGNGYHLAPKITAIDANGILLTRASVDYCRRRPTAAMAALNAITGDFTIEFTASLSSALAGGSFAVPIAFNNGDTAQHFYVRLAGGATYSWTFISTVSAANQSVASPAFSWDGTRARWAITKTGGKVYFFKDGTLLNAGGTAYNFTIDSTAAGAGIWVGCENNLSHAWPGYLDEIRISDAARWTANYTAAALSYSYQTSGKVYSRVYDFGQAGQPGIVIPEVSEPSGASVAVRARAATGPTDQSTTTGDFGATVGDWPAGRFQQFVMDLAGTAAITPSLESADVSTDELVSSRLADADYTAPDNATIATTNTRVTTALPDAAAGATGGLASHDTTPYSLQVQFHRNGANQDVWVATPREYDTSTSHYKPMTGVTAVTLTANKSSDGAALFSAQAMTQVGATGVYKYAASAVVTRGDPAAWSCSVVRSGVTLTFNGVAGRDK